MKKCMLCLITVGLIFIVTACQTASGEDEAQLSSDPSPVNTLVVPSQTSELQVTAIPSNTPTPEATVIPTATPVVVLPPEPIEILFQASDGQELSGLYYPADENPAAVVVLMPWAQGNQSEWEEVAYWLQGRGLLVRAQNSRQTWKSSNWYPERTLDMPLGVFTFNFRSCESVEGCVSYLPVEWLLDAQAALETAAQLEGIDPGQILAVGASIGADGAVNSCAWLNKTELGKCLGAFALSPFSSLTIDFRVSVDSLLDQEDPAPVYCLFGLQDDAASETCGDFPEIRAVNFGYIDDHGLELIHVDRRPAPLNILQEFILEALGGE